MLKASRYALFAALLTLPLAAQAQGNLDKTLAQMDQASKSFKSFQSDLEWVNYEAVLHLNDPAVSGTFYCQRNGGSTELGIHMDRSKPGEYILVYKNGIGDKYSLQQKQVDRFKIANAEGFLAVGCGGSGKDLASAWNIKDIGPETLTLKDGQKIATEKLDLVSKDSKIRDNFSHITVWIDLQRDIAVQQIVYEISGDYKTSFYTHISYNGKIKADQYVIPSGIKAIVH